MSVSTTSGHKVAGCWAAYRADSGCTEDLVAALGFQPGAPTLPPARPSPVSRHGSRFVNLPVAHVALYFRNGISARTVESCPAADSIVTRPPGVSTRSRMPSRPHSFVRQRGSRPRHVARISLVAHLPAHGSGNFGNVHVYPTGLRPARDRGELRTGGIDPHKNGAAVRDKVYATLGPPGEMGPREFWMLF